MSIDITKQGDYSRPEPKPVVLEVLDDIIQYCQYEIKKAKLEHQAGNIALKELQRVARSLNNVSSFANMKKAHHRMEI